MKKIAIFTTTRSDISILIPLIKKIRKSKKMKLSFICWWDSFK